MQKFIRYFSKQFRHYRYHLGSALVFYKCTNACNLSSYQRGRKKIYNWTCGRSIILTSHCNVFYYSCKKQWERPMIETLLRKITKKLKIWNNRKKTDEWGWSTWFSSESINEQNRHSWQISLRIRYFTFISRSKTR